MAWIVQNWMQICTTLPQLLTREQQANMRWLCILFNEKYDVLINEWWFIKLERPTQTTITSHSVIKNFYKIQLNRRSVISNKMQFAEWHTSVGMKQFVIKTIQHGHL